MQMINIGDKAVTDRQAVVEGKIFLKASVILDIKNQKIPKGNVLEAAKVAGIFAAKKTPDILPLCHPLLLEYVNIDFSIGEGEIKVTTTVRGGTKTGVEMEAFTATAVACLTIYDMCKSLDRAGTISGIRLLKKSGGKSGVYECA